MKKKVLLLTIGILLISLNAFADDGDFIVEGNVLIGTDTPTTNNKLKLVHSLDANYSTAPLALSINATNTGTRGMDAMSAITYASTDADTNRAYRGGNNEVFVSFTGSSGITMSNETPFLGGNNQVTFNSSNTGTHTILNEVAGLSGRLKNHDNNVDNFTINSASSIIAQGLTGHPTEGGVLNITDLTGVLVKTNRIERQYAITNEVGVKIEKMTKGTNKIGLWLDGDDSGNGGADIVFGTNQNAGIYYDGTNLVFETDKYGSGLAWFSGEISITGLNTRTPKITNYNADSLTKLTTPNDMLDQSGKLDRNKLLDGEATTHQVTDKNNCWEEYLHTNYCYKIDEMEDLFCSETQINDEDAVFFSQRDVTRTKCGTKIEEGMSLDYLAANNRLLISELKKENQMLKDELCSKDSSYSWCQ